MNILVVEDEHLSREDLLFTIRSWNEGNKIYEASNGIDAIRIASTVRPDVVFLDIHLPDISGLEVAEVLKNITTQIEIVFVTAYDEHAVEAFRLRAFHYLLKPFTDKEIYHILCLIEEMKQSRVVLSKIPIETEGRTVYVMPIEIYYISKIKEEKKISFHTSQGVFEINGTLQEWMGKLKNYAFYRVHKSYMINLNYVVSLEPFFNGTFHVYLKPPYTEAIPVSRNAIKGLKEHLT